MLSSLDWLTLEVKYLDPAVAFYGGTLDLPVVERSNGGATLAAGPTELRLRTPGTVPRGGLHTHYAFSTPADAYDGWWDRLESEHDLVEHRFGSARSLYLYDPDGNCVEIGQSDEDGEGITGIFEVVLEVEDLERAEAFYASLGATVSDRGESRPRVRMDLGPVDLELWEPQLGLADARGGVHVDVGFGGDPAAVRERVRGACAVRALEGGVRLRDPDGHSVTVRG